MLSHLENKHGEEIVGTRAERSMSLTLNRSRETEKRGHIGNFEEVREQSTVYVSMFLVLDFVLDLY